MTIRLVERIAATAAAGVKAARMDEHAVARAATTVAAGLAAALVVVGAANAVTRGSDFFNPDVEGSLFQIVTAVVTAAAAASAFVHAIAVEQRRVRFALLGALLAYVTADDLLILHERVSERVGEGLLGLPNHIAVRLWILIFAPLLLTLLVLVAQEALRVRRPLGSLLVVGLGALVAAVVVEAAGAVTRDPDFIDGVSGKPETLRYLLEEGLELGGWALVTGGLVALVARDRGAFAR